MKVYHFLDPALSNAFKLEASLFPIERISLPVWLHFEIKLSVYRI